MARKVFFIINTTKRGWVSETALGVHSPEEDHRDMSPSSVTWYPDSLDRDCTSTGLLVYDIATSGIVQLSIRAVNFQNSFTKQYLRDLYLIKTASAEITQEWKAFRCRSSTNPYYPICR